jgi:hypothetical protein
LSSDGYIRRTANNHYCNSDKWVNCSTSSAIASAGKMSAAATTCGVDRWAHDGNSKGSESGTAELASRIAPVRSTAVPVAVSFTSLETPHLPAREQREIEIKQIKRRNKVSAVSGECSGAGPGKGQHSLLLHSAADEHHADHCRVLQ